jgi:hypothetical protein
MPGLYERDVNLKIQEVGDSIFIAESEKTPFSRLLKRGKKPENMLSSWPVQKYPARKFKGQMDGTDISTFASTTTETLEAYAQWMMTEGWLVSRLAQITKAAGVKDQKAKQMTDDGLILAQMIEKQLLSSMDTAKEAQPGTPFQSRGVFSWLATAAQASNPVPVNFRPASACVYTSTLALFRPSSMEAMLTAAATAKKSPVDLTGFVGIKLKAQMSAWAQRQDDVGSQTAIESYSMDASEKKLSHVVDFFEFDAGNVNTIPSFYLLNDSTTGEATANSTLSGAFLDLSMWELSFLENPSAYQEPPKSGGPRGYHDAIYILKCLNPLGQCIANIAS